MGERTGEALLNYTTTISVDKTVGEIERLLTIAGANAIMKEYDGAQNITAVSFRIDTPEGRIPFKLPLNILAVQQVLKNQYKDGKVGKRHTELDQARRVGWRIIKHWVEAQTAIIQTQMVTIEQVFLPYAIVNPIGQTLYDKYLENRGRFMALPEKGETEIPDDK
jgi:hypothetical protein